MNILLLGSGGRESALAYKILQSNQLSRLFVAPGNAGTAVIATNLDISVNDFNAIKKAVLKEKITMVIVGPEEPLVNGIHDFFLSQKELKEIPVIGPKKDGATLEGSKEFSKKFMQKYGIPTARYASFTKDAITEAKHFLTTLNPPYVLKADGLAAGKGVLILNNLQEAEKELEEMLNNNKFGDASNTVVIEEFLKGIELSVFVLTDGTHYKILPSAKDYKRIGDGDTGLNTGGMGAASPVPFADASFIKRVEENIIKPTIKGLQKEDITYKGFLFIGLMNIKGEPFVIEYNVRMGDPETEVVIPRIKTDILDLFKGVANNSLDKVNLKIDNRSATTVMLVSGGYPKEYEKGKLIKGLNNVEDSLLFHSGTKQSNNGVVTNGGRVLAVTSFGNTIQEALNKTYTNIEKISFEGMNYRKDIGLDLIR